MAKSTRGGFTQHLLVFGVALGTSLPLYHTMSSAAAEQGGELVPELLRERLYAAVGTSTYSLPRLQLLNRTMYYVDEKYVDPSRIQYEAMFDAALDSVERRVPEVLFRREPGGKLLHIAVGRFTTTLPVRPIASTAALVEQLSQVAAVLEDQLSDEVELPVVEYALINGVLSTLDPHSVLLEPEDSREMEVENSGEFGGLGITITVREGRLTVESPMEGTPAYKVGLQPDDRIVRIDGESTINMDINEAVSKLRGPIGSTVVISVERAGWTEPREISIVRDRIKINPVEGELLADGVGYARIKNFHATAAADLSALLEELRRQNGGELRGLVLDLRGNPGGYLLQSIAVSDLFLAGGAIVSTVERHNRQVDERNATRSGTEARYPMAVLVNANSASASEIVAGALRNNGRAVIIGERTFGKGSVQNLYPSNNDDSQLKLTVARYLTPGGQSIQSVGVPPDIALVPSLVDVRTDKESGRSDPIVALYWRERVMREADLDKHLESAALLAESPVYTVRYLYPLDSQEEARRSDKPDLQKDWEVQFAREVLLTAPATAERATVLASAGKAVATHQRTQTQSISDAFKTFGIQWAPGTQPKAPSLQVSLDLGSDGVLRAGEQGEEIVQVRVTNTGTEPVHQVMAISDSALDWLDGNEFFFGRINPGETRSWPLRVLLGEGYRDTVDEVSFTLYDGDRQVLGTSSALVRTVGQPLPDFAWSWTVLDGGVEGTRGDSDGVVEAGEVVALRLEVQNVGAGPSSAAFAKLKNRSGKDLDLRVGVVELGVLAPGETRAADFVFQARGSRPTLDLELVLGDQDRFDQTAILDAGFYDHFSQTVELAVPMGQPIQSMPFRPPQLSLTRGPGLVEQRAEVTLSGVATDDAGVRDVIVYAIHEDHDEKIFYQGGTVGAQSIPWTVDADLSPGANLFVILTRDEQGLTDIRSVSVWHDPSGAAATAAALPAEGWPPAGQTALAPGR